MDMALVVTIVGSVTIIKIEGDAPDYAPAIITGISAAVINMVLLVFLDLTLLIAAFEATANKIQDMRERAQRCEAQIMPQAAAAPRAPPAPVAPKTPEK
eukprot:gene19599-26282_t